MLLRRFADTIKARAFPGKRARNAASVTAWLGRYAESSTHSRPNTHSLT
ncbi:hypothetical protein [Cupriavidus sp. 8B]